MPDQLYTCANVQLQVRPPTPATLASAGGTGDHPSGGVLTGPVVPAGTAGGQSLLTFFNPTATDRSTVGMVTTGTNSEGSLVISTTFPSITHSFTPIPVDGGYGGGGAFSGSSSVAAVIPETTHTFSTTTMYVGSHSPSATASTNPTPSSPYGPTFTFTSASTVTGTSTVTSCPATLTPCPSDYRSLQIYTTKVTATSYSCDGGCQGVAGPTGYVEVENKEICIRKLRMRLVVGDREL